METNEQWRPVVGWESLYEVSDQGRVRSLRTGRMIAQRRRKTGRVQVCLARAGTKFTPLVHRLVLESFVGPCPPECEAAHNNGNPADNRLSNLRWDTHWNNMQDKRVHGTCYEPKGELHHLHVLTEAEVLLIYREPATQMEMAHRFNIHQSTVSDVRTGRTWSHLTGQQYKQQQ